MRFGPKKTQSPLIDFLSSRFVAQSASKKPSKLKTKLDKNKCHNQESLLYNKDSFAGYPICCSRGMQKLAKFVHKKGNIRPGMI